MSMTYVTGDTGAVTTGETTGNNGDRDSGSVTVEGPYGVVKAVTNYSSLVPSGTTVVDRLLTTDGKGGGKIVIKWINYKDGSGELCVDETDVFWRIEMAEVQTPLQYHPSVPNADRIEIMLWLGTDINLRFNPDNQSPQWVNADGEVTPVAQPYAQKFIECYKRGIETYNRYFPVMEKVSRFKTLPGATMNENKTTGGTVSKFSEYSQIGKFNVPDLHLSGFADGGWFKSGDSYSRGGDRVWTRTEQWTWTPDYNDANVNWIYQSSSSNQQKSS